MQSVRRRKAWAIERLRQNIINVRSICIESLTAFLTGEIRIVPAWFYSASAA